MKLKGKTFLIVFYLLSPYFLVREWIERKLSWRKIFKEMHDRWPEDPYNQRFL
jgi:hypothetical protein